jgi:hypothetical protein
MWARVDSIGWRDSSTSTGEPVSRPWHIDPQWTLILDEMERPTSMETFGLPRHSREANRVLLNSVVGVFGDLAL